MVVDEDGTSSAGLSAGFGWLLEATTLSAVKDSFLFGGMLSFSFLTRLLLERTVMVDGIGEERHREIGVATLLLIRKEEEFKVGGTRRMLYLIQLCLFRGYEESLPDLECTESFGTLGSMEAL